MNAGIKVFVGLAAAVLIAVGLWLGFDTERTSEGVSCGSAFDPQDLSRADELANAGARIASAQTGMPARVVDNAAECDQLLQGVELPAGLIVIGVFGSAVWFWREPQKA